MRKHLKRIVSLLLCVTMLSAMFVTAQAAEVVSEFDFSGSDSLNVYDTYEKKETLDGVPYVEVDKLNRIDTRNQLPIDTYRYGSFLRSSDELQRFLVVNAQYGGAIISNVLTVYADPDVQFKVTDANGVIVASSASEYDTSRVTYYKKSVDNGHNVYYMEFKPGQAGQNTLMIEFSTNSKTVQPHYSFWFGHPLTRTATYNLGNQVLVSLNKPKTSTPAGQELGYYFSRGAGRVWVTDVDIVRTAQQDSAYLSGPVQFTVCVPGMSKNSVTQPTNTQTAHFSFDVNSSTAYSAYGTYNFRATSARWGTTFTGPAHYTYTGQVTISYLYAFGW